MTPELIRQILYGTLRLIVVAIAARFSIGLLDQGTIDQIAGGLTIVGVAVYAAWAKVKVAKVANEKVERLNTVVETKTVEAQVLRAVVAEKQEETGIMVKALIKADIPIPEVPTKLASIEELAAALNQQNQKP